MKVTEGALYQIIKEEVARFCKLKVVAEGINDINKTIAVYSGRFQPFHKGHYYAYKFLVDKFGKENVFIGTSNKVDDDKSPFNFNEKKNIITKMFDVPEKNVVHVKNPYNPMEIKEKFDGKTTAMVVGVGEKDSNRLGGKYYKPYEDNVVQGFDTGGYVIKVPQLQVKINGETISGSGVRAAFRSGDAKNTFMAIYGKMDNNVFRMVVDKFKGKTTLTESIKHIEDIKAKDLLSFLKLWRLDRKRFEINEKVDGHFYKFGIRDGKFFSGSKAKSVTDEKDFPSLYFYEDFVRYHTLLKNINIKSIVDKYAKKFGISGNTNNIEIEAESIPSWDYNIVLYSPDKIGDGIVVLFKIIVDGIKTPVEFHEVFASEANKLSSIKFYANPKVNFDKVHFDVSYEVELGNMIEKYGNILNKPARKPHEKEIKQMVQNLTNDIGKKVKGKILRVDFKRAFGEEDEGLVFYVPDGNIIKIVDKDKFTARKESNWRYIDMLLKAEDVLIGSIKEDPSGLKDYIDTLEDKVSKIESDFEENGSKFITIQKKADDTRGNLGITKNRIRNMRKLLKMKTPEEVAKLYMDRKVD